MAEPVQKNIEAKEIDSVPEEAPETPKPEIDTNKFVSVDDFKSLKNSIESMRLRMDTFGQPQAPQPVSLPQEDTTAKEISDIDSKIEAMNEKIDKAVYDGKGVGALMCERDRLVERRLEIKNEAKFDEIRTAGVDTLDRLSDQVVRTQMPHLDVPEIKQTYETALSQMSPSIRMNPEVRLAAYNHAVGKNIDIIVKSAQHEALRSDTTLTNEASATTSRTAGAKSAGGIPSPHEILTKDNLDAISAIGKTVDQYYQSLGYKGWEDHYEQQRDFYEGGSK
jgi:hypothetical protein